MSRKFIVNPITGELDQIEDISQLETDVSSAIQPGDNVSDLTNDSNFQTASEVNTQVTNAVTGLVDSSPAALDTLSELANALGDDPNFATTVTNQIAGKADASHTHTHNDITDFDTEVQALIGSTNKNVRKVFEDEITTLQATDEVLILAGEQITLTDPSLQVGREIILIDQSTISSIPTGIGSGQIVQSNWINGNSQNVLRLIAAEVSSGGSTEFIWQPLTLEPVNESETRELTTTNTTIVGLNPYTTEITCINSFSSALAFRIFDIVPSSINLYPGKELVVNTSSTVSSSAGTFVINLDGETIRRNASSAVGDASYLFKYINGSWKLITDKYQTKILGSDITTNNIDYITFSNLVIGKTYEITLNYYFEINGASGAAGSNISHGGSDLAVAWVNLETTTAPRGTRSSITTRPFIATATTAAVRSSFIQGATDVIKGDGTLLRTHAIIKELNNINETNGF